MVEIPPPLPDPDPHSEESRLRQWREVYAACEAGLRSFLRGRLAQEVDVEDCLQAVVVKMIQQANKTASVAPAARRAWLFRVAANEAAGLWRKRASTDRMMSRHGAEDAGHDDVVDHLIRAEISTRVRRAVKELPEPMRDVVRLRIEENLTFQQIATKLKIPIGTALTRMRRALERLKIEFHSDNEP